MKIKGTHRTLIPLKNGRVFDAQKNCLTPEFENNGGYLKINIGNGKQKYVHRVVAEAFIPNPENKPCVNHIDGNKKNNHVDNLEWVTYSENNIHAFRTGLQPIQDKRGELNGRSKLNSLQVRVIRRLRNDHNMKIKHVCEIFNIGATTVSEISNGVRWSHI